MGQPERPPEASHQRRQDEVSRRVGARAARKRRRRAEGKHSVWFGLGVFGIIGWSIALPTVLALALGLWIDRTWPSRFSWTLMLLVVGVVVGCFNAWRWVERERRSIERQERPEESDDA